MLNQIHKLEFILYVANQSVSSLFYQNLFRKSPDLDVPGMTSFQISTNCSIGLMPNDGIAKILGNQINHPSEGIGIPRCELYLHVEDLAFEYRHALDSKACIVSELQDRDWGDRAFYISDPDGHIIAFAQKI